MPGSRGQGRSDPLIFFDRKEKLESRAGPGSRGDGDASAHQLHEPLDLRQAETGSGLSLRREPGVEDSRYGLLRHAFTGIAHPDAQEIRRALTRLTADAEFCAGLSDTEGFRNPSEIWQQYDYIEQAMASGGKGAV